MKKIRHREPHGPLRVREYPSLGDQLDAIYKGFKAIESHIDLPPETRDWMARIERIKTKYRK